MIERKDLSFEIEEEDEETLLIDMNKLKEKLDEINKRNQDADIILVKDKVDPEAIKRIKAVAAQINDESHMIEFEDDDE